MKVTLQTNNYKNNVRDNNRQTFGAKLPEKSKFLAPYYKFVDKSTNKIAKYYTAKLYESPLSAFLAKHTEKLKSVVDHMQVAGSIVISGMYMSQTLRNNQLDPQKRKTLAINQGLTFIVSTILSYIIDQRLDNNWEKLTRRYAAVNLETDVDTLNKKIELWNIENKKKFDAKVLIGDIGKDEKFRAGQIADYVEKTMKNTSLAKELKGMGVLKKLLVFGTIYRFISPVAVTPIANWIGNKFIYKPENHQPSANKDAESTPKAK